MKTHKAILLLIFTGLFQVSISQPLMHTDTISAIEASKKIGQYVIVKAIVVSTFFGEKLQGQPTYLNLDQKFPDNPMTVIIYSDQLKKLNINASDYEGKTIVVKGKMYLIPYENSKKKPCIKIYKKDQIKIVD